MFDGDRRVARRALERVAEMCGIVGMMRFDGQRVDAHDLQVMRDTMLHRGPDAAGTYIDNGVGLGLRRLAIIDLSAAGHQPMSNEDGTVWISFNGEIYNYVELRTELIARGHTFSSHTDTEVIVHLYEELGERCVDRLRGMFAFIIWDKRRELMFGARDRIGIKPFHYYTDDSQFVCASEIKAILAAPGVPRSVSREAISGYLFSDFPPGDRTMFEGIRQLPPGYAIMVRRGEVTTRKYWDLEFNYDASRTGAQVRSELADLLDDAVRLHCRSDAELGCHLSGGLDSSIVTGLATRHRKSLKTFSIRFGEGGWYDETEFARTVADFAGAEYFEAVPNGHDFANLLPGLIWHMEMPLPNVGGFSYYTVSRLAANHAKVALTGHGGDEVFAGYAAQFQTAFGTVPDNNGVHSPADSNRRRSPSPRTRVVSLVRRLAEMGLNDVGLRLQRSLKLRQRTSEELWTALRTAHLPHRNPLVSRGFAASLGDYSPLDEYLAPFRTAPTAELLDRCLYHDLRSYLPPLLHMEDRMSMSVSLESRTPLIDHKIVEFMATVPPLQKVPAMQPKGLLREAARGSIPEIIRHRADKRPFPVPFDHWSSGILGDIAREVLLSPQSLDRGVIDPDRLRRWDLSGQDLWSALNLELWFQIFIDNDPRWLERIKGSRASTATSEQHSRVSQPVRDSHQTSRIDPFVSEFDRPQCLLVTFLSLTRWSERHTGSHRRLSLLIDAVRLSGASLRVVCSLTPDEATPSVEVACKKIEEELSEAWGLDVSVVASVSAAPASKRWIVQQAESVISYRRTPLLSSRATEAARKLVAEEVAKKPDFVLAHRLPAMHVLNSTPGLTMPVVFDLDDIEHVITARGARQEPTLRNNVFELMTVPSLVGEERRGVRRAATTLVCSQVDAQRMRKLFRTNKIDVVPNALPLPEQVSPIAANKQILMLGAYGYHPNEDAAEFFITDVLPLIRERVPEAELNVVGAAPQKIPSFHRKPEGVTFHGYAEDLPAVYAGSRIVVCPIRYGGGTRVKLVEAAGWGKPIVSTTVGAEGLGMVHGNEALIADSAETFADACVSLLTDDELCKALARGARSLAEQSFDGKRIAEQLGAKLRTYVKA